MCKWLLIAVLSISLSFAQGEGNVGSETLQDVFDRKIAYTKASPFYKELHTPHNRKFLPKPWNAAPGEVLIGEQWGIEAQGLGGEPGTFAVEELRSFFLDAGGIKLGDKSDKRILLRVSGTAKSRVEADSHTLTVTDKGIEITSPSARGVLYGVYYLEQLLLERGIPAIKPMTVDRKPIYDVRMFGDVYGTFTVSGLSIDRPVTRDTFSALSRFGANATFHFVQLGDYLGERYPELADPEREENLAELKRLADLAHSVGVEIYLDAYNPKLPADHPVFTAHPNARGAPQHGANIRCLCPSDPETLQYIAESWAEVYRRIPTLGGMVAIIGGEGFYHCYMRSGGKATDCPRCSKRSPEDVVADLTNAVFRAIRKVKPDAELLAWPYSAFVWSKEPFQLDLISKLDPGIQFVSEIDKDYVYQKDGYSKSIWDYSIDFLGPSDRYKAQREAILAHGMKQACKTESATSWEVTSVPCIPCMQRWGQRYEIIRGLKPTSIYYAYDCTGFARSRPEELAGRMSWEPSGTAEEEIEKIALRDFGPGAADAVIAGWKLFSEALGHIPYLTHGYYRGPSFIGAAQPLMLSDEGMPEALFGRFFYLAEGDLSDGTSEAMKLRPIYTPDIDASSAQIADMDLAVELWEQGVGEMKSARNQARAPYEVECQRELDMGEYLLTMFRAVSYGNHFFALRRKYRSETDRQKALGLLDDIERIVRDDLVNARRALIVARRDPRLDLSVRLDLGYPTLVSMIEAKIDFADKVLHQQFPGERARP